MRFVVIYMCGIMFTFSASESEESKVKELYEKPYSLIMQFQSVDVITESEDMADDPFAEL